MQGLSRHQLEVLECRIYGVLTFPQIAELLGQDLDSVKHSYYRALGRMRFVIQRRDRLQMVARMRDLGNTWNQIGEAVGVNSQTARMLWYEADKVIGINQ